MKLRHKCNLTLIILDNCIPFLVMIFLTIFVMMIKVPHIGQHLKYTIYKHNRTCNSTIGDKVIEDTIYKAEVLLAASCRCSVALRIQHTII